MSGKIFPIIIIWINYKMEDFKKIESFVRKEVRDNVIPAVSEFIKIPNTSRAYDPENSSNGLQQKACNFCIDWVKKQGIKGLNIELVEREGKTPLVFAEIDGSTPESPTVLMYGHIDKQPHLTEFWEEGLHPTKPVIKNGKLYGRGGADDGYAIFASTLLVKALQQNDISHPRVVLFFETDEESGSRDIPYYLDLFQDKIGVPQLIVCLDSGGVNYDNFCMTSTLRGNLVGFLKVRTIKEGVHSGKASGIVPDTFRIIRQLLSRVEDAKTGEVAEEFHCNIPKDKYQQICDLVQNVDSKVFLEEFPWLEGVQPVTQDPLRAIINKTWKPQLTVTGVGGIPDYKSAGNVTRPETILKISMRAPPTADAKAFNLRLKEIFERDPPYGAHVEYEIDRSSPGWCSPPIDPRLGRIIDSAAQTGFGTSPLFNGVGGSIPFMSILSQKFPESAFIITGVLGPLSNAHGPNESLDLQFLENMMVTMTKLLGDFQNVE